jgi:hypothetical protein
MNMKKYMEPWELFFLSKLIFSPSGLLNQTTKINYFFEHSYISLHNVIPTMKSWSDEGLLKFMIYIDEHSLAGGQITDGKFIQYRNKYSIIYNKSKTNEPIEYSEYLHLLHSIPYDFHHHIFIEITEVDFQKLSKQLNQYVQSWINHELSTGKPEEPEHYTYIKDEALKIIKGKSRAYGDVQTINYEDFDRFDTKGGTTLPFWEIILDFHLKGWIQVIETGYDRLTKKPFAKIRLLDAIKKQISKLSKAATINKGTSMSEQVSVRVDFRGKVLAIYIGRGERIIIKKFKSTNTDNYRAFKALYDAARSPLTRDRLNIKGTTTIKDMSKSMGFRDVLRKILIDYDTFAKTLTLEKNVVIAQDEADELIEYVNTQPEIVELNRGL